MTILAAWQLASYRGYTVAEKRLDRGLVVEALIAKLAAEHLTVPDHMERHDNMGVKTEVPRDLVPTLDAQAVRPTER